MMIIYSTCIAFQPFTFFHQDKNTWCFQTWFLDPEPQLLIVDCGVAYKDNFGVFKYSRHSFIARLVYQNIRDSFIETIDRSPQPLTIEKPSDASINCDDTVMTAIDSTDQSNASSQTSPIRWEPLPHSDKRVPTVTTLNYMYRNRNMQKIQSNEKVSEKHLQVTGKLVTQLRNSYI